jgi:hypothetical protein
MKFIGSAMVTVVILYIVDQEFNNGRLIQAAIIVSRNVAAAIGIHF